MKILQSGSINAFGGINFVYEDFNKLGLASLFNLNLPKLSSQSQYSWKDIVYSLYSIYFCGGDSIEDVDLILKDHIGRNPFCKIPSPDTILRRLKELAQESFTCKTKRGVVDHQVCVNDCLNKLNILLLKNLGAFEQSELTLDYDNTIIYNEKADSILTYKKDRGYQPGVCTLNMHQILYLENRNGNSDAKSFQDKTLSRMFDLLKRHEIPKADNFRADSASYQYDVIRLLDKKVKHFYIGAKNSYVEHYFGQVTNWVETQDRKGKKLWLGDIEYIPFKRQAKQIGQEPKSYRLVVKRKLRQDRQINMITQDAYSYTAVITNDFSKPVTEVVAFYNQRGTMEKQFDVVKNDFGWNHMPFSDLSSNTVFLYFMAMCKNIYHKIIQRFSLRFKGLLPNYRIKRFIFRFINIPTKWIYSSRQLKLRVYGKICFKT